MYWFNKIWIKFCLHFKTVTFTLEKFKCIFYLLLENWEISSKLQKNNKMAKPFFSSFVFFVYNMRKISLLCFFVSLYAFYDLMCYGWLKICYKEPCELMFIYILWFYMLYIYIRFIQIIWMYCAFSHLCNKIATKINYALNHYEFVC